MRFEPNREYQTHDGRRARYVGPNSHPEFADFEIQLTSVHSNRGWYKALRNADGTFYGSHQPSERDIIEITATDEEIALMNEMANANPREFILILRRLKNGD